MQDIIKQYEPTISLDDLVIQINQIHHSFEAEHYDKLHPEVHEQLPPIWKEMLRFVSSHMSGENKTLNVLDYGCGTGFEATQVIRHFGEHIEHLTCYDPSEEMLDVCREKITGQLSQATFFSDWSALQDQANKPFDLIITNSLLHHLPDPIETFRYLAEIAAPSSFWCMGHEPSKRFYLNARLMQTYSDYRRARRLRQLLSPSEVKRKMKNLLRLDKNSLSQKTAQKAYELGIFKKRPPESLMGLIVDYHVAHSINEAETGRGFCFQEMENRFTGAWELGWKTSYSFMGRFYEGGLSPKWKAKCDANKNAFPDAGANFATVWQKA